MADVRALLKAKREEKRISHPFASYNQAGQLRCTACSTIVKYASAWNGHVGSKTHRTNAAHNKEKERQDQDQKEGIRGEKRNINGGNFMDEPSKKRRVDDNDNTVPSNNTASGFPSDFFSDPSRSIPLNEVDSDQEEVDIGNPSVAIPQPQPGLDLEWANFKEAVINAPAETDARETYERATIFVEPQLSNEIPQGFPSSVVPKPIREVETEIPISQRLNDEGEERRRRQEEEKELIMDRLLDEERAQEEADERVNVLKGKLNLLKQRRRMAANIVRPMK